MSGLSRATRDAIDAIEAGPTGPQVGAFFDLDGTLVSGYTGTKFFGDQVRKGEIAAGDFFRTAMSAVDGEVLGGDPTRVAYDMFNAMRGQSEESFAAVGERLFLQKIAGTIRNEARALVRAHQRMGHTVAVASAATRYQIAPVARDLGIDHLVCTHLEVDDGVFTGKTVGPMLWGRHKAAGVRGFAREHDIDLGESYGYGNGYEDVAFLSSVGFPTALNPHAGLEAAAQRLGWPVLTLRDPVASSLKSVVRTAAALASLNAAVTTGLGVTLATGDRRKGLRTAVNLVAHGSLPIAGVRLRVQNRQRIDEARPAIYIANHQSALDPAVLGLLLERDFMIVGKKEAQFDPRSALSAMLVEPIWIDRSNSKEARASLAALRGRIGDGQSLMIFPEGTRSATPVLGPFRKGAFHLAIECGVPIVPIVLRNTGELMRRNSLVINPGTVDVTVLEPEYDWDSDTMNDRISALHDKYEQTLARWPEGDAS